MSESDRDVRNFLFFKICAEGWHHEEILHDGIFQQKRTPMRRLLENSEQWIGLYVLFLVRASSFTLLLLG